MIIVGIDPGMNGGLAVYRDNELINYIVMPTFKNDKGKTKIHGKDITKYLKENNVEFAVIELVHAFPGQGSVSNFTFGQNFGTLIGILDALNIDYLQVSPSKWKNRILKDHYDHKHKNGTISWVIDTFGNINLLKTKRSKVPHDGLADAIAIGHYYSIKDI